MEKKEGRKASIEGAHIFVPLPCTKEALQLLHTLDLDSSVQELGRSSEEVERDSSQSGEGGSVRGGFENETPGVPGETDGSVNLLEDKGEEVGI